jgi:2,3,4,5-tetrahydropyridine-2-carboxylate N-succinyltransferase
MPDTDLAATIDAAWEGREQVSPATRGAWRDAVETALEGMDEAGCASPRRMAAAGGCING